MNHSHTVPPSIATIDLSAIVHNFRQVKEQVGKSVKVLAVVKSDAYGHGIIPVAKKLSAHFGAKPGESADTFGVSFVHEGISLRKAGITEPILVLGGAVEGEEKAVLENDLTPLVSTIDSIQRLAKEAEKADKKVKLHIKVDTGMSRLGMAVDEVEPVLKIFSRSEFLIMEGLCTHLAYAFEKDQKKNRKQLKRFHELVKSIRQEGYSLSMVHACNSAGIFACPEAHYSMVRAGIVLYGSSPFEYPFPKLDLRQAMRWETSIINMRKLEKGASVSYGGNYTASKETLIATLPIGYAHGLHRSLSGKIDVLVQGQRVPQAGTICMDFTTIDVTELEDCQVGDKVVILGSDGDEFLSSQEMAEKLGSIPYEVYCHIGRQLERKYIE